MIHQDGAGMALHLLELGFHVPPCFAPCLSKCACMSDATYLVIKALTYTALRKKHPPRYLNIAAMNRATQCLEMKNTTSSAQSAIPTTPISRKPRRGAIMDKILFESFTGEDITECMLEEASRLFSENYGIWAKDSGRAGWCYSVVSLIFLTAL
jgi:hypothetical protein